jgi:endonuclease/exonuclease/phosphatase family metal-dependent hydrolase
MRSKHLPLALAAALAATLAACGDDDEDSVIAYADDGKLTVMTRNLFLGADLDPVIAAIASGDGLAVVTATTAAWNRVQANDFNVRAVRLADEIAVALPDVVALQEATLWRTGAADGTIFPPNAAGVVYDFLAILQARLRERQLDYVAAQTLTLFDVEAPTALGVDVRLTDRLVILVRNGVPVAEPETAEARTSTFTTLVTLPGVGAEVLRGWTATDVTIGGERLTVVNTHLESVDPTVRTAQAGELVAALGGVPGPVVLMGDLNSVPGAEGHLALTSAGFSDVWATVNPADPGLTCCFGEDLGDATATLSTRIDHVLVRAGTGTLAPEAAVVVGEELADRTAATGGLWPSDHAGVVATLQP